MGIDSLAENTPNAPAFICPICLPQQVLNFNKKKASFGVRSPCYKENRMLTCKTLHCDMFHVQFVNGIHGNVLNCLGRKYSRMNLSDNNAAVTICSSYTAKP